MIQITTHPQNITVNAGVNATFTVSVTSAPEDGALSYKWQKAEPATPAVFVDIPSTVQGTYQTPPVLPGDSGSVFRCVITAENVVGETVSDPAVLTVQAAVLSITSQPQSLSLNPNDQVSFSVQATSTLPSTLGYQWQYSPDNTTWTDILQFNSSSTYVINFASYDDVGWYRCLVTSPLASNSPLISSPARLELEPTEISIVSQPESKQVFITQIVTVEVEAEADFSQPISYQWQYSVNGIRNWFTLESGNSAIYTISGAEIEDTGYYRCILTNPNATTPTVTTDVVQISVRKPTITITSSPTNQTPILTLPTSFLASAVIDFTGQTLSYVWQYSTDTTSWNDIPGGTSNVFRIPSVASSDAGYYRCAVNNALARITPVYTAVASLQVLKPTLQIVSQPVSQTAYITRSVAFSVLATIEGTNVISYQWQYSSTGTGDWSNVPDQTLSTFSIDELAPAHVGFYRCEVSNPNATAPIIYSSVVELVGLVPEITIGSSDVNDTTIDYGDEVEFSVSATSLILINYQWQRKAPGSGTWEDIDGQTSRAYNFTPDVVLNGYEYRCRLSNRADVVLYSPEATLTINPAFYILTQPQDEVNVRKSLVKTVKLITVARSTNPALLTYQWEVYNASTSVWDEIEGATATTLVLDVEGMEDVETTYRCVVDFSGDFLYSDEARVILRTDLNLYFKGCFEHMSLEQNDAIEELGVIGSTIDRSCSREEVNTCGFTFDEMFRNYPIYSSQKGLYKSWGNIPFNWEVDSSIPNLLFSSEDNKWSVSTFREVVSYFEGDRVILMEDNGYKAVLYEATEDILSFPGAFDSSKWKRVCYIETTIPAGLPSLEELYRLYKLYNLEFFYKTWSNIGTEWEEDSYEQSLSTCMGSLGSEATLAELQKCIDDRKLSTDKWNKARARREFFYRAGDIVLVEGECKDIVCAYIATQDVPATEEIYEAYKDFEQEPYWQKLYCLATGSNKCLEYQRKRDVIAGYDVVELGSKGHYVEVPVPYRLRPTPETLDRRAATNQEPVVLTQAQIDALNQPQED